MSVIQVSGLTFTYAGAKSPAIMDVNLEVSEGEFILIVGPSGEESQPCADASTD